MSRFDSNACDGNDDGPHGTPVYVEDSEDGDRVECEDCGERIMTPEQFFAAKKPKSDLPERLRKQYGRNVPEGDGWSWEWRTDELAEEAARYIEKLESQ